MSQIKENTRNTTKIWRHAKDSIRCTGKYDQNLKNNFKTSNNLDVWKVIFILFTFLIGCHGTNRIYLPTIDHKNRQSMYINQGCRFGPESKPNSGKQYLDPAWYHLWRIVSEHVFWEHICKHCVKLECFAPILTKHSMYGTFTYVYHKDYS